MSARVAVLDDEPRMVEVVAMLLRRAGYDVAEFTEPCALLGALEAAPVDLLLTDLTMPGMDGVAVLERARETLPGLPVILFTAHATVQTAIAAMKKGAYDYVEKPFDNAELRALVARALEHSELRRENRYLKAPGAKRIVAQSAAMRGALALARRVAPSRSTVLVTGESGTGKEVIARAIHYGSARADGPFVALNVKALSDTLLESELFGHVAGAFTGARADKPGVFERADGGTLLLDEIGEVSGDFQAKLLRVLAEREVLPVGGTAPRPVDVRLVAATHRDLEADVRDGRFREDLFFRLNVVRVALAPLRERREDILPLARAFLARIVAEEGRDLAGLSPELEAWLLAHDWPGNVRELENAIERGAVLARGDRIELADVAPEDASEAREPAATRSLAELLDLATAEHLRRVLDEVGGKRVEAARRLGVERTTLYRLMRRHGLA
ncbi:MAG: sigma-54-dependent Fis family transcriptional regulator [Sandaracinaceae bacterium]|nr:sigma-54-dependent Fis family transcriptional regulator [Sandaracinaceae bacterium]